MNGIDAMLAPNFRQVRDYKQRQRKRESAYRRGYGERWRKARRWFLSEHPRCTLCQRLANVVDHVVPHRGDQPLFWDVNNWQALCKQCHDRKTGKGL